ncbi:MAG: hypothetical protein ABFD18_03085 [Syntrophomonas sp.]
MFSWIIFLHQILNLIIILAAIYGIVMAIRYFKDLKRILISINEKLDKD